jgi:hypothetical protein
MVDTIIYELVFILPYLAFVSGFLLLLKGYLFFTKKSSSWKLHHFFFFDYRHIETSFSEVGKRNKQVQNIFSIVIAILFVLAAIGFLVQRLISA